MEEKLKLKRFLLLLGFVGVLFSLVISFFIYAYASPNNSYLNNYVYVGSWEWYIDEGDSEGYWAAPIFDSVLGILDLRSITDMGQKGRFEGDSICCGVFVYDRPILSSDLGLDLELIFQGGFVNPDIKDVLITKLDFVDSFSPFSSTFEDMLWEIFTVHSDSTGLTGPKPIIPERDLGLRLYLYGISVDGRAIKEKIIVPEVSEEWQYIVKGIQEDYRELRESLTNEKLGMWLSLQSDKYNIGNYESFKPEEFRDDGIVSVEPKTTIQDDFNRGDGSLNNSEATIDSVGQGWTWSVLVASINISSNIVVGVSAGVDTVARAEEALSSADHFSQVDIVSMGASSLVNGPGVRIHESDITLYSAWSRPNTSVSHRFEKFVTGTRSELTGANESPAPTFPGEAKFDIEGTTLTYFYEDVQKIQITDSSISGNLYTGLTLRGSATSSDNFMASDGLDPTPTPTPTATPTNTPTPTPTATPIGGGGGEPTEISPLVGLFLLTIFSSILAGLRLDWAGDDLFKWGAASKWFGISVIFGLGIETDINFVYSLASVAIAFAFILPWAYRRVRRWRNQE